MNTSTLLFTGEQVKRFFDKLGKQSRTVENKYLGYDKKNPEYAPCGREVFVKRTINKWLKNKYLIIYKVSEQTNIQYKEYVSISNISFGLGYSDYLNVTLYNYSKPMNIFDNEKITHNNALNLEGEWCETGDIHHTLLKLTYLDIPEKEYVFCRYDWSKYPKRGVKREKALEKIKTTISFKAKTLHEAYGLKKLANDGEYKGEILELLEVKEIIDEK